MKKRKTNFKNFFTPDLGKVVVVYFLCLITIVVSISWITPPPKTMRAIELSLYKVLIPTRFHLEGVVLMISWVIYWYLLSCPIIWIHKKVKK